MNNVIEGKFICSYKNLNSEVSGNRTKEFEKRFGNENAINNIKNKFMNFASSCGWADDVENLEVTFHTWFEPTLNKTLKYYDISWYEDNGTVHEHGTYDKGWFSWDSNGGIKARLN